MELETARKYGEEIVAALKDDCIVNKCRIVGETRRACPNPRNLEILCAIDMQSGHPKLEFGKPGFATFFDQSLHELVAKDVLSPLNRGNYQRKFRINAIAADLILYCLYDITLWGIQAATRTGPLAFAKWIVTERQFGGGLPDGHRVDDGWKVFDPQGNVLPFLSEGEFFEFLGLPYISPEKRDDARSYKRFAR